MLGSVLSQARLGRFGLDSVLRLLFSVCIVSCVGGSLWGKLLGIGLTSENKRAPKRVCPLNPR